MGTVRVQWGYSKGTVGYRGGIVRVKCLRVVPESHRHFYITRRLYGLLQSNFT